MTVWESKPTIYKELRPQEILNSEENVQRVTEQNVIENEYLNPFGLMDESDEILNTFCKRQRLYKLFRKERLLSCEKLFHLIALINTMVFELPSTYEEFAQKLMQRIPKNYKWIDLLSDDYKSTANSFKLNEQAVRG